MARTQGCLVRIGWGLLAMAMPLVLAAQTLPSPLKPWQQWVVRDVADFGCPTLPASMQAGRLRQCVWPGRLALDIGAHAATFTLAVSVDGKAWVSLPGDAEHWPLEVRVNGGPAPVLEHGDAPSVRLTAGDWSISGAFAWDKRPARLAIPANIGMVALTVDGHPLEQIERSGDMLTLGKPTTPSATKDALAVKVYRLLHDGAPAMLHTRIELDVSGTAREVSLANVLPEGFVGVALETRLPARLEHGDNLAVQVRPGHWQITLHARSTGVLADITLGKHTGAWPATETWSYRDRPSLRHTRVEGQAVDASRAEVPGPWQQWPAFVLDADHGLQITQLARGSGEHSEITVQRQMWLDFDGDLLSVRDSLRGDAGDLHRLTVAPPWQLASASADGEPLLVTGAGDGRGVEIRNDPLVLSASLQLPGFSGPFPVAGWQTTLSGIQARLSLPPGFVLLGAPGADHSPDSWVAHWNLLELFVAALIVLLAGRLLGWRWALVAAGYLLLAGQEWGAPRWSLLVMLTLALLAGALPEGRLRQAARIGARLALAAAILVALPFAVGQMRLALYPQLAATPHVSQISAADATSRGRQQRGVARVTFQPAPPPVVVQEKSVMAVQGPPAPPAPPAPAPTNGASQSAEQAMAHKLSAAGAGVVPAGPGIPDWDLGNNYTLAWQGPVTPQRTARLVIAPAWLVSLLRVALLALLAALLARTLQQLTPKLRWLKSPAGTASAAALMLALAAAAPSHAQQPIPDATLRQALRTQMLEPPACSPHCATLASARIDASSDTLVVELVIHSGATWAAPLPTAASGATLAAATVDGSKAALVRHDHALLARVERGIHRVVLRYALAGGDQVALNFPLPPRHVVFNGSAWHADGLVGATLAGDSLTLRRIDANKQALAAGTANGAEFPPYVRLQRHLFFGSDWTVFNNASRIAPERDGFSVRVPRLPGAHPLGDNVRVDGDEVIVTFRSGERAVHWRSRLQPAAQFALHAPDLARLAVVWQLSASPNWHVVTDGVPETASGDARRFLPLPGETLAISATRPKPISGGTLAFDQVHVTSNTGAHAKKTSITMTARSTRGGEYSVLLPADAKLLGAYRDGHAIMADIQGGKLSLPVLPGRHHYTLAFSQPTGVGFITRSASATLGAPIANLELRLQLPQDRWDLLAFGPGVGPAILYWPLLAVFLLLAWLLARFAPTPLRFHHWLLLTLGFSAFSWAAFAFVVAWLIALGARARIWPRGESSDALFNAMQIGLALMTALAIAVLVAVIPDGLLGAPNMHIAGNSSTASLLRWFVDRVDTGALPVGSVVSLPLWVYKVAILAWALWLANALIGWLRWAFAAWSRGGYWRSAAPPPAAPTS